MSTIQAGKLGGQYGVQVLTTGKYRVSGLLHGNLHTIYIGDYEVATKLMDYCASHDADAQAAIQALYFEADPTPLMQLIKDAEEDLVAKPRRRVQLWIRVGTDILESENAIELVTQRMAQACGLSGLTLTQLDCYYADEDDDSLIDQRINRPPSPYGVSELELSQREAPRPSLVQEVTPAKALRPTTSPEDQS